MTAPTPPRQFEGEHIFLVPGSMFCTAAGGIVSTVLGSCVSLCLWDGMARIGGMNHYVLPRAPAGEVSLRYGDVALDALWRAMAQHGAESRHIRAKLFGGAAVLPISEDETVGEKNVRLAYAWLGVRGVPVMAAQTGGKTGLHVRFDTGNGGAEVRGVSAGPAPR